MIGGDVRGPSRTDFSDYRRYALQTYERAGLATVDRIAKRGKASIRGGFRGAGLGRLGNAIDAKADQRVRRIGAEGFSVSAQFFARTRSERTLGAIEAYTEGAEISPRRGRYLWIATDEIPRVTNRQRMTPALYKANGFEQKIGPLVFVRSVNGNPLLVVQGASVNAGGKSRSAKSLTKRGALRKGQRVKEFIVAFVGIPRTARAARVSITEILQTVRDRGLEATFAEEVRKAQR